MEQYGFEYNNFQGMQSFINSNNINRNDNVFIQVFTGIIEIKFINNIIDEITSIIPQAEIIGATTAGEIYNGNAFSSTTIISFTVFEKTKIKTTLLSNDNEYKLGVNVAKTLIEEDTKVIILFSDAFFTNGLDLIKGIESVNRNVIVCGGKAGDNGYFKETFVFTKEGITKNGIAAVSLTGKYLNVITDNSFSWSPIGKLMTVTKADDNKIFTIDNVKALDIYKKYLGEEVANELPMSGTEFPLIIRKKGIDIARVAFDCHNDGSLSFLGKVEVNDKVQFGYGNVSMIKAKALEITDSFKDKNIEAIFVYSCSVRKSFMRGEINIETQVLNEIAPTVGFFTYGEFFTCNNSNELLNITMTILGISEGEQIFKKNEIKLTKNQRPLRSFFEGKYLGVIKVFTNLVDQVTKELQEANKTLEEQKYKIEQMNNVTKSIMEINSKMLSSFEIDSLFEMILDKAFDIIPKSKMGNILVMKNNRLSYKATKGYFLDKAKEMTYGVEEIHIVSMYDANKIYNPMIVSDLKKNLFNANDTYNSWKQLLVESPYELLTCGIGIDGHILGFIDLFNTSKEEAFNEDDKNLIKYLCSEIAIALKNAQLLENILHMSRYDSLTGLYNRGYFTKILNETANRAKLSNEVFVICMVDLNNLKIINDTYGHDAGDSMLINFASTFKSEISENDVFGRMGGDEFLVIFINKNKAQVIDIINNIYRVFKNNSFDFNGCTKEINFAYGLSQFLEDSDNVNELYKIADKRMYEQKRMMKKSDM